MDIATIDFLTAILVIITAFYAWATFHILKANQKVVSIMYEQTEAISRPYITAATYLMPDSPIFSLRIKNTGKTPALNLSLSPDKNFYKYGHREDDKNLASYVAFQDVIENFPPGAELIFDLAQSFVVFGKESDGETTPTKFTITATYSYGDKTVSEKNIIDLRPYFKSHLPDDPYVNQLKKLRESIDKIGMDIKRIGDDA